MLSNEIALFFNQLTAVVNKYGYLNSLTQLRNALANLQSVQRSAQPLNASLITKQKTVLENQKLNILNLLPQMQKEVESVVEIESAQASILDRLIGSKAAEAFQQANETTPEPTIHFINEIINQLSMAAQVSSIFATFNIGNESQDQAPENSLVLLFTAGTTIDNLKTLSKQSSQWNQAIICFSRMARENDTESKIHSVSKGSIVITIILV